MAPSVKVVCPSCGSGLKVSKPSLLGKRVPCPSCKQPFLIEVPAAQARELAAAVAAAPSAKKSGESPSQSGATAAVKKTSSDQVPSATSSQSGIVVARGSTSEFDVMLADTDGEIGKVAQTTSASSSAKKKAAPESKNVKTSSTEECETILLAEDDDPFDRPLTRSGEPAAAKGSFKRPEPPRKNASRDGMSGQEMSDQESAEFDAMLSDTEDESDDLTQELPERQTRAGRRSKGGADTQATAFDTMLHDTDEDQDELLAEVPAIRSSRKTRKGPGSAGGGGGGGGGGDEDDFDVDVSGLGPPDDDLGSTVPLPRQRSYDSPGKRKSNSNQRLPLIIGAFVGCTLLMGLLIYSISGAQTPSAAAPHSSDAGTATADGRRDGEGTEQASNDDASAAETPGIARGTAGQSPAQEPAPSTPPRTVKNRRGSAAVETNPVAGGTANDSDNSSKGRPPGADGDSANETTRSSQGSETVASTIGAGVGTKRGGGGGIADGGAVGRTIGPFSAAAVDKTTFRSADCQEQVLVVAFMGVECPLANLYYPRLVEVAKKCQGKSVRFVAVNSNAQDTLERVHDQARTNRVAFPVLKDAGNEVADAFGAERTPEVFVLDAARTVRYHGMIDDQYGYRQRRGQPTKNFLADAIESVLAGKAPGPSETEIQGCHIGRATKPSATAKTSYYRDILPVLQNRCQQCHRKGEIGPFSLADYADARDWGPTIRESVTERRMPPWPADPHFGKFSNDMSLTDGEIEKIVAWVDEGCPEGNAADKPPAKKFVEGWNIGKPDKVYTMPAPYRVAANGVIEYQNFHVSSVFTQDTWVQAVECRFGNRAVVHHMLVLLDFPKDHSRSQDGLARGFFAAGAPGSTYFVFPKGYAKKIPKGARLRFQMHYTPNGSPSEDQSKFGIVLAKGTGLREVQTYALGKLEINIPAGAADHWESYTQDVQGDVVLTTLMPHLHLRGKSFKFTAVWPDGKQETLLSVPRWDFNWQPQYQLEKPIKLPRNSKIVVEAHWDNSEHNPNNILPPVDVTFGEQTFDEMFIGYVNFVPTRTVADGAKSRGSRKRG